MRLTKPTFSLFAEDFELMKAKLSSDEIVDIFSALSDLCMWGECDYTPQNTKQAYFWEKLKTKFDYDLSSYRASVENGKKGGRPKKETQDITQTETQNKTQDITHKKPSCHLSLEYCNKKHSSDKSSECKKIKLTFEDVVDWESLFDYWEQNKKGGKYKTTESRGRQLAKLKELTNENFEYAKQAIVFCIDNKYQGFTDGSKLYYRNVSAAPASRKTADDDAEFWAKVRQEAKEYEQRTI